MYEWMSTTNTSYLYIFGKVAIYYETCTDYFVVLYSSQMSRLVPSFCIQGYPGFAAHSLLRLFLLHFRSLELQFVLVLIKNILPFDFMTDEVFRILVGSMSEYFPRLNSHSVAD